MDHHLHLNGLITFRFDSYSRKSSFPKLPVRESFRNIKITLASTRNYNKLKDKIMENNKLIAEFMDGSYWAFDTEHYNRLRMQVTGKSINQLPKNYTVELNFDTSWDWLMPVVEKIESMGYDTNISCMNKKSNAMSIDMWNGENVCYDNSKESKIKSVYSAVIKFIAWFNTQSPT